MSIEIKNSKTGLTNVEQLAMILELKSAIRKIIDLSVQQPYAYEEFNNLMTSLTNSEWINRKREKRQ